MTARITASVCFDIINNAKDFAPLSEDQVQILVLAAAQHAAHENRHYALAHQIAELLDRLRTSCGESAADVAALF